MISIFRYSVSAGILVHSSQSQQILEELTTSLENFRNLSRSLKEWELGRKGKKAKGTTKAPVLLGEHPESPKQKEDRSYNETEVQGQDLKLKYIANNVCVSEVLQLL